MGTNVRITSNEVMAITERLYNVFDDSGRKRFVAFVNEFCVPDDWDDIINPEIQIHFKLKDDWTYTEILNAFMNDTQISGKMELFHCVVEFHKMNEWLWHKEFTAITNFVQTSDYMEYVVSYADKDVWRQRDG